MKSQSNFGNKKRIPVLACFHRKSSGKKEASGKAIQILLVKIPELHFLVVTIPYVVSTSKNNTKGITTTVCCEYHSLSSLLNYILAVLAVLSFGDLLKYNQT